MTARPTIDPDAVSLEHVPFENTFVRELPADPVATNVPRPVSEASYTRVEPTPVAAPRLLAWSRRPRRIPRHRPTRRGDRTGRPGARRQSRAARHAAVRRALRRPPVRPLGGPARRRPRDHARRDRSPPTASAGSCSSRARARRPTRAPPTAARCCARRCASSCAARRCTTSACRPRARSAWSPPASRWSATCSTTAIPQPEPGAIVCRVAPSFLRFGNFEILAARDELDALQAARRLHVIRDAFPELGATSRRYALVRTRSAGAPPR